jgi:hypothetical protein
MYNASNGDSAAQTASKSENRTLKDPRDEGENARIGRQLLVELWMIDHSPAPSFGPAAACEGATPMLSDLQMRYAIPVPIYRERFTGNDKSSQNPINRS